MPWEVWEGDVAMFEGTGRQFDQLGGDDDDDDDDVELYFTGLHVF